MVERNFYVFRIAKGYEGGEPTDSCPIDMHQYKNEIHSELSEVQINKIPYETNNHTDYIHRELWQYGKLRQGWGLRGLDLRPCKDNQDYLKEWIKNYIVGAKRDWGVEITENDDYCKNAIGRYNILKLMLEMKKGDIIFIPKHSCTKHHDENHFTVCEVVSDYYFDLDEKYRDFGHTIIVKNLKTFPYSTNTLLGEDLGAYRKAIGKIQNSLFLDKIKNFVNMYYL